MSKETGEPAFPAMTAEPIGYGDGFFSAPGPNGERQFVNTFPGMTLRDYFAAHALQGLCAKYILNSPQDQITLAQLSYELSDAMIAERGKA